MRSRSVAALSSQLLATPLRFTKWATSFLTTQTIFTEQSERSPAMPAVQRPSILDVVRSTCKQVSDAHQQHIQVNQEAIAQLASQLDPQKVKAAVRPVIFPVRFDSVKTEITLIALYHLLDFGSGYDPVLQQRNRRDARDTTTFGAIGLFLSGKRLDAPFLKAFNTYDVHNYFGLQSHDEAPVEGLPGVTMSRPGVLHPLSQGLAQVMQETGQALEDSACSSLGEFVLGCLEGAKAKGRAPTAAGLVSELVDNFPGFADTGLYDGMQVQWARKAQNLVADLHVRFAPDDERFRFPDVDKLTADSGNVLPAVLRAKGVLQYSEDLAQTVDAGEQLPTGPHERALRACGVTAVDAIVGAAGGAFNALELSRYLVNLIEEEQELHGKVKRHLTVGTFAY